MLSRPILLALALTLAAPLVGCGKDSLQPFDWAPEPAPRGPKEDFTRIGVCYNRQTATPEQVLAVAQAKCEPGTTPYLIDQDMMLVCPLLTPMRATYACVKAQTSAPPQ
jgi:hypothetical protein